MAKDQVRDLFIIASLGGDSHRFHTRSAFTTRAAGCRPMPSGAEPRLGRADGARESGGTTDGGRTTEGASLVLLKPTAGRQRLLSNALFGSGRCSNGRKARDHLHLGSSAMESLHGILALCNGGVVILTIKLKRTHTLFLWRLCGLAGSALNNRPLPPYFESQHI